MGYPLSLPVGSVLYFDTGSNATTPTWTKLSEHNRAAINLDLNRIEKTQRMSNGSLRKIWIADKKEISTSWTALPTYSSLTVDGGYGAADIKAFYLTTGKGTFKIKISYKKNGKVSKKRIYLGVNLEKKEIFQKELEADKELKLLYLSRLIKSKLFKILMSKVLEKCNKNVNKINFDLK